MMTISIKIKAFSTGSEFAEFVDCNCTFCRKYNFSKPKCKIDKILGIAYCTDGMIPIEIYDLIKTGECKKFVDKKTKRPKRIDKKTLPLFTD